MIQARNVRVVLGDEVVLDGVDLEIQPGEILGIIGPPEAGKTVLLKTLAGLVTPAAGTIRWNGARIESANDAQRTAWQRRIGMAFQNDALFDAMTVYDNVAFPLRRRRIDEEAVRPRVRQRLRQVGLEAAGDQLPSEISGGMRKRVGIARATVTDPELGLFDEPIAGLDPVTGARILELIVGLTNSLRMATIIISNDLPVLLPVCQRVMMLSAGRVVYWGAPDDLIDSSTAEVVQFVTGSDAGPL